MLKTRWFAGLPLVNHILQKLNVNPLLNAALGGEP